MLDGEVGVTQTHRGDLHDDLVGFDIADDQVGEDERAHRRRSGPRRERVSAWGLPFLFGEEVRLESSHQRTAMFRAPLGFGHSRSEAPWRSFGQRVRQVVLDGRADVGGEVVEAHRSDRFQADYVAQQQDSGYLAYGEGCAGGRGGGSSSALAASALVTMSPRKVRRIVESGSVTCALSRAIPACWWSQSQKPMTARTIVSPSRSRGTDVSAVSRVSGRAGWRQRPGTVRVWCRSSDGRGRRRHRSVSNGTHRCSGKSTFGEQVSRIREHQAAVSGIRATSAAAAAHSVLRRSVADASVRATITQPTITATSRHSAPVGFVGRQPL